VDSKRSIESEGAPGCCAAHAKPTASAITSLAVTPERTVPAFCARSNRCSQDTRMLAHEACSVEFLVSQCGHDGLRQNQIRARSRGQLGEPLQQYVLRRARRTKQLTVLADNNILCQVKPRRIWYHAVLHRISDLSCLPITGAIGTMHFRNHFRVVSAGI
jgi:hypothetical protein